MVGIISINVYDVVAQLVQLLSESKGYGFRSDTIYPCTKIEADTSVQQNDATYLVVLSFWNVRVRPYLHSHEAENSPIFLPQPLSLKHIIRWLSLCLMSTNKYIVRKVLSCIVMSTI